MNIHVLSLDTIIPDLAICPKKIIFFFLDVYAKGNSTQGEKKGSNLTIVK